ncbi:hypothetical protein NHF46_08150 [Arthrobacter alpinus]|nr:hypothetical protein [Arthrobacter alpinus]
MGCEGGKSGTRKRMGVSFEGKSPRPAGLWSMLRMIPWAPQCVPGRRS